jgi:hypothetical protein
MLEVTDQKLQLSNLLVDSALLAYGEVWTADSSKMLMLSSDGHWRLGIYDWNEQSGGELWPAPPLMSIEALQTAWSPDNTLIAVIGDDYPMVRTEHGRNFVTALWITKILPDGNAEYTPISDPKVDLDRNFTWIDNRTVAYASYVYDRQNQLRTDTKLVISDIDGDNKHSFSGDYQIVTLLSENRLLLLKEGNFIELDLNTFDFTPMTTDASISDLYAIAPNRQFASYVKDDVVKIINLEDKSEQSLSIPMSQNAGWWRPDGKLLIFLDYEQNRAYSYDPLSQEMQEMTAKEFFRGEDNLPMYPGWLCTSEETSAIDRVVYTCPRL